MARPPTLFDDRNVETLAVPSKGRTWFNSKAGITGFRLAVYASGARSYFLQYRVRGATKPRTVKVGTVGEISYKEAKKEAERLRGIVATGKDPVAEEQAARAADQPGVTLRDAFAYYLEHRAPYLGAPSRSYYAQAIRALPKLMDLEAEAVTAALFRDAAKKATDGPVQQNRYLTQIKAVLRFAFSEELIGRLPGIVAMKRPNPERRRERVLSEDEIKALWKALDAVAPEMPKSGKSFAAAVRTMLLLGTRLGETIGAEWSEIDLKAKFWRIPAQKRKGQDGKRQSLTHPLSPLALDVLTKHHSATGDRERVFHGFSYDGRTFAMPKLLATMKADHFTPHDLRRTMATHLATLGCPREVLDVILGHATKGVIAHYDHSKRADPHAEWLKKWSDKVAALVTGQPA